MKEIGSSVSQEVYKRTKIYPHIPDLNLNFLSVINSINKIPSHKKIKKNNVKLTYQVETSLMCCYFEAEMDLRGKSNHLRILLLGETNQLMWSVQNELPHVEPPLSAVSERMNRYIYRRDLIVLVLAPKEVSFHKVTVLVYLKRNRLLLRRVLFKQDNLIDDTCMPKLYTGLGLKITLCSNLLLFVFKLGLFKRGGYQDQFKCWSLRVLENIQVCSFPPYHSFIALTDHNICSGSFALFKF